MINDDDLEEVLLGKRKKKTHQLAGMEMEHANHQDHDDHGDTIHGDWDQHTDGGHQDWDNHVDTHTDWGDHDDASHDDWDNHNDWPWSDWDNHSDSPYDDWDAHADRAHTDYQDHIDHEDYVYPHDDWDDHADDGHSDWTNHDDDAHLDWDQHTDNAYTDWDNHNDASHDDWDNHDDSYNDWPVHQDEAHLDHDDHDDVHNDHDDHADTVPKEDTVICDFDILDTAGENVVTDLYAGVKYWVRAWLCKVEGGGCAEILKGCDSGCEIPSEELKLFLFGQAAPVASGATNENGYTAFPWTPSEDIGSVEGLENSIRVEFGGSAGYNSSETAWKTVTVTVVPKPYTINVTVNDQGGNPLEGAYVDIDGCVISCIEKKCTDVDVAVYVGECKEEEWKGDGYNVVTASVGIDKGKVSIGLPVTEETGRTVDKWRIRVGKSGYLNESLHDDWTAFKDAKGEGTYNFVFTLTFITVEDKFVVHTKGLKEGDEVWCCEQLLPKCLLPSTCYKKTPDAYPDGKVEFTTADGLTEGNLYGIGAVIHWVGIPLIDTGPSYCGDFKGIREITIYRYGVFGMVCELLGIDSASEECRRFWAEMIDPVYCANCITGVLKGEDVHGAEYHPGKFELAMFPVVVVCSFIPWLPGAKITKFLGRFFKKAAPVAKHGDNILAVRKYFEDDYLNIYRIQVYGDEVRLKKWADAIDAGDVTEAKRWADDILANHPAVTDAVAVGNFNSWLDELTKQIDSIDPKHADEIADLRARVLETANACMDDVTDFTRVYDEKYTEFIDVARRGSGDKTVSTFVRAADGLCSPGGWHCKFSFVNALGDVTVGTEKVNLWDVTAVLHKQGLLDETKYVYKNIIKAFAHADEAQIRALRLALEAENYDEVIRLLNDLPRVDMEGRLIARHFNNLRVKALDKWADRSDEILTSSRFLDEEIDEIAGIAGNNILWYRFAKTADTRENLFINMLRNASRGPEVISPAGRSAFTSLSFNNGDAMLEALRRMSDSDYMTLSRKLGPATEEGKLLEKLKRLQIGFDDGSLVVPSGTDVDTWVRIEIRNTISGISPSQYGGPWPELANRLTGEFPTMTPDRVVAECSMLTDDFKAADGGVQWGRVRAAGVSKLTSEGYTMREAELLIDGKISLFMKELTKKPFTWAIDHPLKAAGAVLGIGAAGYAYVTFGFWIVWYYEELPQMTSMPMYMAVKNENWLLAAEIWVANRATIGDLESKAKMVKLIWPLWADWLDTCIEAHKASNKAYLYMIDPSAPMPKLPEGQNGHVLDVIDSDTIWSGMPDSKLEEMIEYTKAHDPQAAEPKVDAFIPPTLTIRFAGVNGPDKGDVGGYWIHRIATIGGEPEIVETTGDCYTNANTWTYTALSRKDVFILSDQSNQWETFRKGRICRFIGVIRYGDPYKYASEELIRSGWGKVYFHDANKQVSTSKYLTIETTTKTAKLGLWSPACIPCPATGAWFNYYPRARVGETITFEGHATGCDDSEITDWKWIFPHSVEKTGRVVTHKFLPEDAGGSFEIHLKICADSIDKHRNITVTKAYTYKVSPCPPFGDVDGDPDGYVNDTDAKLVSDYIDPDLGWDAVKDKVNSTKVPDETEFKRRADVGNDDKVTQDDVNKIYEFYVGDRNSFPVCPGKCPTPSVDFSVLPSSPEEGKEVLFTCKSSGGNGYSIVKRKWDFGDGHTDEDNHGVVTHVYSEAGRYDVWLTVTNDCDDGETGTKKKTITVSEKPIPPPDKGDITIITYATRKFVTPLAIETFYIDGATVAGTYSCTKTDLSVGSHTVKIDFKEAPHTCYVDKLDDYFDTCEFSINVVKDTTTVIRVCPARGCLFISDPSGASIYIKQVDAPSEDYKEIPASYVLPLGTYSVRFTGLSDYGTLEAVITVRKDKVICESVTTAGGHCYTDPTLVTRPGLLVSGFLIKSFSKEAATRAVTFLSIPPDAEITVLD